MDNKVVFVLNFLYSTVVGGTYLEKVHDDYELSELPRKVILVIGAFCMVSGAVFVIKGCLREEYHDSKVITQELTTFSPDQGDSCIQDVKVQEGHEDFNSSTIYDIDDGAFFDDVVSEEKVSLIKKNEIT
ncbi:hypothetical protein Cantr_09881 [Candida viswanathii]|uniref:Uncharacterized protein n=1 Tax=Candida viswanathii TaxID=5486 RepID=A0A367YE76_9ASCO|nr:hypothetical protein Cantr_09881 [Candida viswanathii]